MMSHGVLIHLMVSHGVLCLMETQYISWRLTVCSDVVSWFLCLMKSQGVSWCLVMSPGDSIRLMVSHGVF